MWFYVQTSGKLLDHRGKLISIGYSGNGNDRDHPASQEKVGRGPLPVGQYTIGPPHAPADHLGPLALPLWPATANHMFGRSGFFIHGDNTAMNHTASNGCIILPRQVRQLVSDSPDRVLQVVATDDQVHVV